MYLFCPSSTNISTPIPAEIKHGLHGRSQAPYHLSFSIASLRLSKSTVEHTIARAVMKTFFKGLLKSGNIDTFHLAVLTGSGSPVLHWHFDTLQM